MKIFVTGACGYLGSILVPRLLRAGHEVIALDNLMYQQTPLLDVCHLPNLTVVRGDCREGAILQPLLAKADVIIPLAAIVGMPACERAPWGAKTTNLDAIADLARILSPDQIVIYPMTNSGYGTGGKEICTEESPLKPVSLYGRLKVDAERVVMERENSVSLRLATAFGVSPRIRIDLLLNEFVWKAISERSIILFQQHYMRNFCHVRDIARAFLHAINNFSIMRGQIYNVGDSRANMSKRQLCERIRLQVPGFYFVEVPIAEDPDKRNYFVSNEKIEKTGWFPYYTIDDGIRELIKLYQYFRRYQFGNM